MIMVQRVSVLLLTNSGTQAALVVDGVAAVASDRVLVQQQT